MTTPSRLFEDFRVGDAWESMPTPLTAEAIIDFASVYDPQPMHTDVALALASPFKGLIASGWHIAALSMQQFVRAGGHGGTPVIGLGVDELRWHAPARAGDTLTVRREVIEVRRSATDPSHGIVRTRVSVRNQDGLTLMTLVSAGRVPARGRSQGATA